jgi:hypothetical protein
VSALEEQLAFQISACRLPPPQREYVFAKPRRWRWDFCWPDHLIACEVQGGAWVRGRHTRGKGATADAEKFSTAAVQGWRVIVVVEAHITSGQAVTWIEQALNWPKVTGGVR